MMLTVEWSDWRDGWFWWIQSVYVDPAHRRRGVYAALHEHVRALARGAGDVVGLRLYVERDNTRARRVYQRLGMRPTGYLVYEEDWSGAAEAP
jgi:GNAT superfamily N-acetyltransferase